MKLFACMRINLDRGKKDHLNNDFILKKIYFLKEKSLFSLKSQTDRSFETVLLIASKSCDNSEKASKRTWNFSLTLSMCIIATSTI